MTALQVFTSILFLLTISYICSQHPSPAQQESTSSESDEAESDDESSDEWQSNEGWYDASDYNEEGNMSGVQPSFERCRNLDSTLLHYFGLHDEESNLVSTCFANKFISEEVSLYIFIMFHKFEFNWIQLNCNSVRCIIKYEFRKLKQSFQIK